MNEIQILALVFICGVAIYLVGHSFIDAIFDKKGELIDKMIENERGEIDG